MDAVNSITGLEGEVRSRPFARTCDFLCLLHHSVDGRSHLWVMHPASRRWALPRACVARHHAQRRERGRIRLTSEYAALANLSFRNPCCGHDIMTMDKRRSP
jgi:hypothetical protein